MPGHFFYKQIIKINIINYHYNFLCLNFPSWKIFLICSHSLQVSASLLLQNLCLKKCVISLVVMGVHGFLYNQPQLLRVEV